MTVRRDQPSSKRVLAAIRACRHCVEAPHGKPLPHEPRPVLRASRHRAACGVQPGAGHQGPCLGHAVHRPLGRPLARMDGGRPATNSTTRAALAIVPMGFCFPGQDAKGADLPPRRECAPRWHGDCSRRCRSSSWCWRSAPTRKSGISARCGRETLQETMLAWRRHLRTPAAPRVLPLPHPSWRNNGWLKRQSVVRDRAVCRCCAARCGG